MVPKYALRSAIRNCALFVPAPRQMGSNPLAKGSRVPRCPIFSSASVFFTIRTTEAEDIPSGLSINKIPFTEGTTILSVQPAVIGSLADWLFPAFHRRRNVILVYGVGISGLQLVV